MSIRVRTDRIINYVTASAWQAKRQAAAACLQQLLAQEDTGQVLGWRSLETAAVQLELIKMKAMEIKVQADVFIIVGVGGSNQAARAVIEALKDCNGPEIMYLGNTLSPHYIDSVLKRLVGKSVYINVIAKNFETLEPGSHFRILRQWMRQHYTEKQMAERVVLTGTRGSRLEAIADENGYLFLEFPQAIGGRYSAFSPVALLPIAAAGLDIDAYLKGGEQASRECRQHPDGNPAVDYAAARNILYEQGYDIEILASFEPQYGFLSKWWIQLFGESEGKAKKGIFPAAVIYSEDLHSMGQYLQDGRRNLIETFLSVAKPQASVMIEPEPGFGDGFDYLDGMDFDQINKAAEKATIHAHAHGGVPCLNIQIEAINEASFGELFYCFMAACAVSGILMGVNPFDQEGVEEYKRSMFAALGKE